MLLADLGADVVRIDRRGSRGGLIGALGATSLLDRGKRSIALDLKAAEDLDVVHALVRRADVLLEGFRPGVMERLGLGPDELLARQPALVYGRMTGWGQTGPLSGSAGHDIGYIALTGALGATGRPDERPAPPMNLLGDFGGGGVFLALGALAALVHARATGEGQVVDAAIVDGTAVLTTMIHGMLDAGAWRDRRGVNLLDTGAPFYDVYRCADGQFLAVGALEEQFYAALLDGLGLAGDETLPDRTDPRQWPALRERFTRLFASRTRAEWWAVFQGTDACVAPVWSLLEATTDPHNVERGGFSPTSPRGSPEPPERWAGCRRRGSTAPRSAPNSAWGEAPPGVLRGRCGARKRSTAGTDRVVLSSRPTTFGRGRPCPVVTTWSSA